eukprot:2968317-Rhodomonas_salina.2
MQRSRSRRRYPTLQTNRNRTDQDGARCKLGVWLARRRRRLVQVHLRRPALPESPGCHACQCAGTVWAMSAPCCCLRWSTRVAQHATSRQGQVTVSVLHATSVPTHRVASASAATTADALDSYHPTH